MIGSVRRRFWSGVHVREAPGGFSVHLDERPLATPGRRDLVLPVRALAEAVAAEWDATGAEIAPERLHFTRAANSAIDRVAPDPTPVVEVIAAYGDTDLVCYRATEPADLLRRQSELWDPWLDWSRRALGAPLLAVSGVMHHPQPAPSLAALRAAVAEHDAFGLVGLHDLVTLSGSLVLGLAVARGELGAEAAWELSRLDELWQAEQWGNDAEAEHAAALKGEQFQRSAHLLRLLRD
jgi:chaperone required for assembly of F1-ATPase